MRDATDGMLFVSAIRRPRPCHKMVLQRQRVGVPGPRTGCCQENIMNFNTSEFCNEHDITACCDKNRHGRERFPCPFSVCMARWALRSGLGRPPIK